MFRNQGENLSNEHKEIKVRKMQGIGAVRIYDCLTHGEFWRATQLDWNSSLGADLWKAGTQTKHVDLWDLCSAFTALQQDLHSELTTRAGRTATWMLHIKSLVILGCSFRLNNQALTPDLQLACGMNW